MEQLKIKRCISRMKKVHTRLHWQHVINASLFGEAEYQHRSYLVNFNYFLPF